jgi:hypothetical protein
MSKIEIFELEEVKNDRACLESAKQFKNYVTIRRDLRNANAICDYIIKLHGSIVSDDQKLHQVANTLFLISRGALMHAVVLYARWFKATTGKPTLSPVTFFSQGSPELQAHEKLVDLRDKYIAHNQLDILGSDRVWVKFDSEGAFESTESDWLEQQFIKLDNLDMELFQRCIHIIHDHIDATILPDRQQKLNTNLARLYQAK